MRTVWNCSLLLSLLISVFGAGPASAQNYPTKPIRLHTAGAGATADFLTRLVANELGTSFGQSVIVENKPAGAVLATSVSKAAPDGYTLLVWAGGLWLTPLLGPQPWELREFAPIAALSRSPNILVVTPSLAANSVAELIKLAKAKPGQLNYSSGQNASSSHLAGELFKSMAGIEIVRISYKGGPQESMDLQSGQVHMTFGDGTSSLAQHKAGKLRALAHTALGRSALTPDLPAVADTLPGFISEQVYAFWAPAKTPEAIVKRLNQETARALVKPEVRDKMLANGLEPVGGAPEQLLDLVKGQVERTSKVIKAIAKPGA